MFYTKYQRREHPDSELINNLIHLPSNTHKKCPFCRVRVKSFVGNIQMRQLIEKMMTLKEEESVKIKHDLETQESNHRNKEMLKFRKSVLSKELKHVKRDR